MNKHSKKSPDQKNSCSNGKRKQNNNNEQKKKIKLEDNNGETSLLNPWYLKNNNSSSDPKAEKTVSQSYPWSTQRPNSTAQSRPRTALLDDRAGLGSASRPGAVPVKADEDDSSAYEDLDCAETAAEVDRYKSRSIQDAVQAIMSDGGLLKDGVFVRENTPNKKKNKKKKNKKPVNSAAGNAAETGAAHGSNKSESCNGSSLHNSATKQLVSLSVKEVNQPLTGNILKDCKLKLDKPEKITDDSSVDKSEKKKKSKKAKQESVSNLSEAAEPALTAVTQSAETVTDGSTDSINSCYTDKSFKKTLKQAWSDRCEPSTLACPEGAVVLRDPFKVAHLPDFVASSSNLLARLRSQLLSLPMRRMNNDLYKFQQSDELPETGACLELRQLLLGPVRKWLRKVTGIPLDDRLALSASLYTQSDVLLCHDDELCGRRVAFILYLVEQPWGPGDGGSLDLFSADGSGRPDRVVQRLYPRHNSFAFFQVSPVSFHQVSEVLSPSKARLSVSGWLFGPDIERPPRPLPPLKLFSGHRHVEMQDLYASVSPLYLAESLQASIRSQFRRHSEIQLDDFVPDELHQELCRELRELREEQWSWTGPPNRRHYQVCPLSNSAVATPPALAQFLRVLRSEAMMLVLSQLTGLSLHPLAPPEEGEESDEGEVSGDEGEESGDEGEESGDEGEESGDEEEESEDGGNKPVAGGRASEEEGERKTLKTLLKEHKKRAATQQQQQQSDASSTKDQDTEKKKKKKGSKRSEAQEESQDICCGLDQPWVPDVGDQLLEGSSSAPTVSRGSSTAAAASAATTTAGGAGGAAGGGAGHVVYSSVRRFSHGCYSLMMDDDNTTDNTFQPVTAADGDAAAAAGDGETGQSSKKKDKKDKKKKKEAKSEAEAAKGGAQQPPQEAAAFVLDLYLSLNVPEHWSEDLGGHTTYVAKGDKEELLSVAPRSNSLALVYRDADTFSFLKHVNCGINSSDGPSCFHQIFCQYK